ncbi:probable serine/threonine-protein kinase clkA [Eupeodes corollae]|uniref:probable serine/threonine-protein kinase clkA n=1 Tax=Eupeodes corollae TaxID=290404 RepID=UPI00249198F6|nr:probable serine/threonine-protein kinase clkA [Eupeodes corollae]
MDDNISPVDKFKIALDLITRVPEYSGNREQLIEFIERVDNLIPLLNSFPAESLLILKGYLRDRITGKAREAFQKRGRITEWNDLRTILIEEFGERVSSGVLIDKMRSARVKTTIESYYNEINNYLCRINNVNLLQNNNDQQIIASNNRIALEAFKHSLPEPTKTIILSRNPKSLRDAYKIILETNHQDYGNMQTDRFSLLSSSNKRQPGSHFAKGYPRQEPDQGTRNYGSSNRNQNLEQFHSQNTGYNNSSPNVNSGRLNRNVPSESQNNFNRQLSSNSNSNRQQQGSSRQFQNNNNYNSRSNQSRQLSNNRSLNNDTNQSSSFPNRNQPSDGQEPMDVNNIEKDCQSEENFLVEASENFHLQ